MFMRLSNYAKILPPDFKQRLLFIFPEKRIVHLPFPRTGNAPWTNSPLAVLPAKQPEVHYRFDKEIELAIYRAKDSALANATDETKERLAHIHSLLSKFDPSPLKNSSMKLLMEADALTACAFLKSNGLEKSIQLMAQATSTKRAFFGNTSPEFTDIILETALMYLHYGKFSEAEAIFSILFDEFNRDIIKRNVHRNNIILNLSSIKLMLDSKGNLNEANILLQDALETRHPNYLLMQDLLRHNLSLLNQTSPAPHPCVVEHLPISPQPLNKLTSAFW